MLVRNADNLMQAVVKTLRAAEAASVKVRVMSRTMWLDFQKITFFNFMFRP